MAKEINTIGVLTSDGDAPGMNAAIRAVVSPDVRSSLQQRDSRRALKSVRSMVSMLS